MIPARAQSNVGQGGKGGASHPKEEDPEAESQTASQLHAAPETATNHHVQFPK
jgi:hypothetical protein